MVCQAALAHRTNSAVVEPILCRALDLQLNVEKQVSPAGVQVSLRLDGDRPCRLHWGLSDRKGGPWRLPPASLWPAGTERASATAVQTPFAKIDGASRVVFPAGTESCAPFLVFALHFPDTGRWDNNRGQDYCLALSGSAAPAVSVAERLDAELKPMEVLQRSLLPLDSGDQLALAVVKLGEGRRVTIVTDAPAPVALHWGLTNRFGAGWRLPPPELRPDGSAVCDAQSVETPFLEAEACRRVVLDFPGAEFPPGLAFVLHQIETGRWLKRAGQDVLVPLAVRGESEMPLSELAEQIVHAEKGPHGWTLMHRFNLCHDLVPRVEGRREAWTTLFVWLRFSAIRQLDWQRNYNTKPRELSHAQDRLTLKLAEAYAREPGQRDLIRLCLGCLGRGGEGQRIRDEILQIMHRHHIKEVGGTWMEQWHQKLHNNTTPDDIVICEAFLAFLRGNGDLRRYDETLAAAGVTRERLAAFERPINRQPEWHPHLKDALIHEFENYLRLLRSVHSGTDLDTAVQAGGGLVPAAAQEALRFVQHQFRNDSASVIDLVRSVTYLRGALQPTLHQESNPARLRDGLYLDLALEDALRVVVERVLHVGLSGDTLVELVAGILDNLLLTEADAELAQCLREWQRLPGDRRFDRDWALHAKAALDRLRRAISANIDRCYGELQPQAEQLGQAFQAEPWSIQLFSEAVVRGRPAFVLSALVRHLDPLLRRHAKLGDWQIISPNLAVGEVVVVDSLQKVQGQHFPRPTVIVAESVAGDEEPPEGVRAVITPSSVDLVSHVAVRARNARLLFATCYDRATFDRLRALERRTVRLEVNAAGDVSVAEATDDASAVNTARSAPPVRLSCPLPATSPLRREEFAPRLVGGKSCHLRELSERLPDWIRVPRSVALPFATFEAVLREEANAAAAARYQGLLDQLDARPAEALAEIRRCVMRLRLPVRLQDELRRSVQSEGLAWSEDWGLAEERIKQVWASKWNDRAYFSRQARGFPHASMHMAVLIQQVVEAEHAFVIHTVNPLSGNSNELYLEVVMGLGETLVGNYPGRAMSCVCAKADLAPGVLAYPSKSVGLYGRGLIFRSDSNAEDLEGYAGAGLYDSVLLTPPEERRLDYTQSPLVWDAAARETLLRGIARVGLTVEQAFGAPQDIEGAICGGHFYVVQTRPQVGL